MEKSEGSGFLKENLEILKAISDETRLDILNILFREDSYVEKLACELSLTPATICYHLKKMELMGLVKCSRSQFYIIYSLNREIFEKPLYEFIRKNTNVPGNDEKYEKRRCHTYKNVSLFMRHFRLISNCLLYRMRRCIQRFSAVCAEFFAFFYILSAVRTYLLFFHY